jgi:hypothetical protein
MLPLVLRRPFMTQYNYGCGSVPVQECPSPKEVRLRSDRLNLARD